MSKEEVTALANEAALESGLHLSIHATIESKNCVEIWFSKDSKDSLTTLMMTIDTRSFESSDSVRHEIKRRLTAHYSPSP